MTRIINTWILACAMAATLPSFSLLARADDDDCRHRVHEARERLQHAIDKYGEDSPQARERHEQLEHVRRECNMRDEDDRDYDHHDRDDDHDRDHNYNPPPPPPPPQK
jgi:hypothetical protein